MSKRVSMFRFYTDRGLNAISLLDSLTPLGYELISQFDTEITMSDYLMSLTSLFEVNMLLRIMRVLRGDRGILLNPTRVEPKTH